ncbi:MAG: DinB family protein [Coprothermobacterota bacterium]|nr:DinB family protein [Coprothermobacterota bacterium]
MIAEESQPREGLKVASITADALTEALRVLLEEVYVGPPDPKATWVTTNALNSGVIRTLESIPFNLASQPPGPGMNTIAAHAAHLLFSLRLAWRSMKGEDAYANVNWSESWRIPAVDEESWQEFKNSLRCVHADLLAALRGNLPWDDGDFLKGVISLVGHGAYHLGAIRQIQRELTSGQFGRPDPETIGAG